MHQCICAPDPLWCRSGESRECGCIMAAIVQIHRMDQCIGHQIHRGVGQADLRGGSGWPAPPSHGQLTRPSLRGGGVGQADPRTESGWSYLSHHHGAKVDT